MGRKTTILFEKLPGLDSLLPRLRLLGQSPKLDLVLILLCTRE